MSRFLKRVILFVLFISLLGCNNEMRTKFKDAEKLLSEGNYLEAHDLFLELGDYNNSSEKAQQCMYEYAESLSEEGSYKEAAEVWLSLEDYSDSSARAEKANSDYTESCYQHALKLISVGNHAEALVQLGSLNKYKDSESLYIDECYNYATELLEQGDLEGAVDYYQKAGDYKDSAQQVLNAEYNYVLNDYNCKSVRTYRYLEDLIKADYQDAQTLYAELYKWKMNLWFSKNSGGQAIESVGSNEGFYLNYEAVSGPFYGKDDIILKYYAGNQIFLENRIKGFKTGQKGSEKWGNCSPGYLNVYAYDNNNHLIGSATLRIY